MIWSVSSAMGAASIESRILFYPSDRQPVDSEEPNIRAASRDREAVSIIESFLLGTGVPEKFDVGVTITKLFDMTDGGIGEEVSRMRWRHDKAESRDLLARETIRSFSSQGKSENKQTSLAIYFNDGDKIFFRDLPHKVSSLKSRKADSFREASDAPVFALTGIIPFTYLSLIPSRYIEPLRKNAVTLKPNTRLSESREKVSIAIRDSLENGNHDLRQWLFDSRHYVPISTSSNHLDDKGERIFNSGSFAEHFVWGRLGDSIVPLEIHGERLETISIPNDEHSDRSDADPIEATVIYDCELSWFDVKGDQEKLFDTAVLKDVEETMKYLDYAETKSEATELE